MQRLTRCLCMAMVALSLIFAGADSADAKKSNSNKRSSRARKEPRQKAGRGRVARSKGGAKRGKLSRRDKRGRGRYAARKRRGREVARSRQSHRQQEDVQESAAPVAPRTVAGGIPTERVIEIQNALVKAGYLDGPASGQYDEQTAEAMKKFQASNNLPRTGLPSAHTLKRLGVSKRSNDGYAVTVQNSKKPASSGSAGAPPNM